MLSEIENTLSQYWQAVRGNAWWDVTKWIVIRQVISRFRRKARKPEHSLLVRLRWSSETLFHHQCRIELVNLRDAPVQNVKVQMISIRPVPSDLKNPRFPIMLISDDGSTTINPHAAVYFDFIRIETEAQRRRITFGSRAETAQTFEANFYRILREGQHGYVCEVLVSAIDVPETKVLCKLVLQATSEDALGLTPIGGYRVRITSEEAEALAAKQEIDQICSDPCLRI
jgi:hypothetical protein